MEIACQKCGFKAKTEPGCGTEPGAIFFCPSCTSPHLVDETGAFRPMTTEDLGKLNPEELISLAMFKTLIIAKSKAQQIERHTRN